MTTLAQDLRSTIAALDAAQAQDSAYRNAFSTSAKTPLRQGETWRLRLIRWCEKEEGLEPLPEYMERLVEIMNIAR